MLNINIRIVYLIKKKKKQHLEFNRERLVGFYQ